MEKVEKALYNVGYLDKLSTMDTPVHRLDPRIKLVTTLVFIFTVVSFDKYAVSAQLPFLVYPVFLATAGNLPLGYILRKLLIVSPFALLVGIFNPVYDREIIYHAGSIGISGGWISFASIMMRFLLTVSTAFILIATTGFNMICLALEKFRMPRSFVIQLLLLYRYLFVLIDEALRMIRARSLRSFGKRGMGLSVAGSMIGQLLLRTVNRAKRIHLAMLSRGFTGEIHQLRRLSIGRGDILFLLGWSLLFLGMRLYNIPELLGKIIKGF